MASFKSVAIAFGLAAACATGGSYYVYNMAYKYSEGSRTGTIFKLSEKGRLCKTWEGQMMMNGYGAIGAQGTAVAFEFTVMDEALVEKIRDAERRSKNVELEYRQAKWTLSCLQESEYVVTGIKEIDRNGQPMPYAIIPRSNKR
jgi:hypothetical protein